MKKRETTKEHRERINEVLYHIFKYLSTKLVIEDLAKISSYSPFHFQRIFKEITNKSVVEYIKDSRLHWAANLLIFNPESTITEISHTCGFQSSSTFTNEFKKYYKTTPTSWRKGDHKKFNRSNKDEGKGKNIDFSKIEIKKIDEIQIAYIRHQGFDKTIKNMWQKFLYILEDEFEIQNPRMLGFHHSNPSITSLQEYRYIACIDLKGKKIQPRGEIGLCSIEGGLYATYRYQGICEDVLTLYKYLYYEWLPSSEFETLSSSAHVLYYKNNYLEADDTFDIEFRIPIKYK